MLERYLRPCPVAAGEIFLREIFWVPANGYEARVGWARAKKDGSRTFRKVQKQSDHVEEQKRDRARYFRGWRLETGVWRRSFSGRVLLKVASCSLTLVLPVALMLGVIFSGRAA